MARFVDENEGEGADRGDADDDDETPGDCAAFAAAVKGARVPAAEVERELAEISDVAAQARAYKISGAVVAAGGEGEPEAGAANGSSSSKRGAAARSSHSSPPSVAIAEVGPLSDAVACRIALRDC